MSKVTLNYPIVGQKDSTEEPKVTTALKALEEFLNGAKIESTDNIKPEGITEASLDSASKTLLNSKSFAALTLVEKNEAAFTAASGELVAMVKEASTLTLPEPTKDRVVGVFCGVSIASIKVKCTKAATRIFGDFLGEAGLNEIVLTKGQHVIAQGSGTAWVITAGGPKEEATWAAEVSRNAATAYTPSATRPTDVILEVLKSSAQLFSATLLLGGSAVGKQVFKSESSASENVAYFYFQTLPGETWEITGTPSAIKSRYRAR